MRIDVALPLNCCVLFEKELCKKKKNPLIRNKSFSKKPYVRRVHVHKKGVMVRNFLWVCWRETFSRSLESPRALFPKGIHNHRAYIFSKDTLQHTATHCSTLRQTYCLCLGPMFVWVAFFKKTLRKLGVFLLVFHEFALSSQSHESARIFLSNTLFLARVWIFCLFFPPDVWLEFLDRKRFWCVMFSLCRADFSPRYGPWFPVEFFFACILAPRS